MQLEEGRTFTSQNGARQGRILKFLGEGGQGAVYLTEFLGSQYALKWYHDEYLQADTRLRERLSRAISRGAPDRRFLWPIELVTIPGLDSFGYVMDIRPSRFHSIRDLIAPPPDRIHLDLRKRLQLCNYIADSFFNLHAIGFCYQDINFDNIFFHPDTADVLICDNDNVNVDLSEASIYGTRKFMAPEIVRREVLPNTRTDLFSMSVLFFYIIFGWHPLDGKREAAASILSPDVEFSLYGSDPLFIFDPNDTRNEAVSPMHDTIVWRWNSLPRPLRDLFVRSFTEGLGNPYGRVLEREWINVLQRHLGAVFACDRCRYEHVAEPAGFERGAAADCAYCGEPLLYPPMLKIGRTLLALQPGCVVSRRDVGDEQAESWQSAGIVERHPVNPEILGLKNISDGKWLVSAQGKAKSYVNSGRTVMIADGIEIDFGYRSGVVIARSDERTRRR